MTSDLLIALVGFAFVTSVTPGPNNLMLMASGVNFGLGRTVPHMLGVSLGHAAQVFLVGQGLAQVFAAEPRLGVVLKVAAVLYMLWLAWKIANAAPPDTPEPDAVAAGSARVAAGRPLTFLQAAAFQWVNPKAWAMSLTAVTVYAPGGGVAANAVVAGVFCAVNLPSVALWAAMGQGLRRLLTAPGRTRAFNRVMAVLLVASLWPVLAM